MIAIVIAVAIIIFAPQLIPQLIASTLIATAVTAAVVAASAFALSRLTAPKPSALGTGPPSVFRQSISNSFIVYGRRRVGGLLVFFHSVKTGGKHYRYFVIACAGHRCAGNPTFMLNDDTVTVDSNGKVTSGPYADAAWLWFVRGTDTDVANATFVSECGGKWTSAHKGLGIAKIYAKFRMNDDVIEAGLPNITVIIDGKDDITDPRDDSEGFTNNAALVFYDWMQLAREEGGFGAYDDEIPSDDWVSAQANVCDETVDGEARYAIDAVITTGAAPSEVRDTFVTSCAGSYSFSEGKHKLRVGYWVPPSETLTEDTLAGPIVVSAFDTADNAANEVSITYIDPTNGYQSSAASTQTTDPAPTDIRQMDLDLPFIISRPRAERIGRIMLNRAQCEKTVVWPMTIEGLKTGALDVVTLNTPRYNLSNYAWVITNWGLSPDFGVTLNVREENAEIYDDPTYVAPGAVPDIDVPDPILTDAELQNLIRTVYPRELVLTGVDDGGGLGHIEISDHYQDWSGIGAVAITGVPDITGLTSSTLYFVYCDIDEPGDTSPTFGATDNYSNALNSSDNPNRVYLNQVIIMPGPGAPPTTGVGSGGGYGGGEILPGPIE